MPNNATAPKTIDEYIAQCPEDVQPILERLRVVIQEAAPQAVEKFSYGMPGFAQNGSLVWFAVNKKHIGFYPTGSGVEAFKAELGNYQCSKGTVQLPLDQPLPEDLIRRMVQFKVAENQGKTKSKY
jgi:uncharacterized protein YdhG (YjbR/CyaY superfamily)